MESHFPRSDLLEYRSESRRKWVIVWIMLAIFAAEVAGGYFSRSLSLLSDAGHVFGDMLAALTAIWIDWKVFKNHKAEDCWRIRGARFQGLLLLVVAPWIAWEAWRRMTHQEPIASTAMIIIAAAGMIANYFQHRILQGGKKNITRTSFDVHILFDMWQSVAVVLAGIAIAVSGALVIDLVVSGVLAVVMTIYGFLLLFFPKLFDHHHHH